MANIRVCPVLVKDISVYLMEETTQVPDIDVLLQREIKGYIGKRQKYISSKEKIKERMKKNPDFG